MIIPSLLLALPLLAAVQDAGTGTVKVHPNPDAATIKEQLPSYPLATCTVSGKKLGSMGDPIDLVVEGRLLRLCCKGCVKRAKSDPAAMIAKVDAGVVSAQGKTYPMKYCPISGEALGSMGKPIDIVVGTRLVKVCCKGCTKKVLADPGQSLAKVDSALIQVQRKTYPVKICLVSGEDLGSMGEPVDLLYGTRLVRLCCKGCKKAFHKEPAAYLAKLDAAAGKKKTTKKEKVK